MTRFEDEDMPSWAKGMLFILVLLFGLVALIKVIQFAGEFVGSNGIIGLLVIMIIVFIAIFILFKMFGRKKEEIPV